MKKLLTIVLAMLVALAVCCAALANETAANAFDKAAELLFDEHNVTLSVKADFSLDGTWFKTVEGTWKQDGDRSVRELSLTSPKMDGTERHNGYTIVTEGSYLYLMEVYTPGVYRTGYVTERDTILRSTVESVQLVKLGRVLASQADLLLGQGAVTAADGEIRISLGTDVPELVNIALNQAYNFAAKRWFDNDYDTLRMDQPSAAIDQYATVTQGILYCARGLELREAEVTLKTDADGSLTHAEGSAGINLNTNADGAHRLDITFTADVTDRGQTALKPFNPDDYGVTRSADEEAGVEYTENEYGETVPVVVQRADDSALKDDMMIDAMRRWSFSGYNMTSSTNVDCEWTGNYYEVRVSGGDNGVVKTAQYSEEGEFWAMELKPAEWLDGMDENDEYDMETGLDPAKDQAAQKFMVQFLKDVHYGKADQVKDLELQWTFEKNGNLYASYEDRTDPEASGVTFVVKVAPEMWIESYCEVCNG